MNVLVTGGTGFIGTALCERLAIEGHSVWVLSRHVSRVDSGVTSINHLDELVSLGEQANIDVVVNLAGEPIADKRWSEEQKESIIHSRIGTTRNLIELFKEMPRRPSVFISGSAVGYYGVEESDDDIDEHAVGDDSFSSQLCQQWESIALQAEALGIRTCLLRTGIVLGEGGGALSKMLLPFKLGLGGRIGSGSQWMPWVHLDDMVSIIMHCMNTDSVRGAVNATAPSTQTNRVFSKTLAKALNRPAVFPMPAFVVRLLMGQMGEELLLAGKKVVPKHLTNSGFVFQYPELEDALNDIVRPLQE